ncbi:hypothetical protein SK355_08770 [Candidatus Fukatsuia symbiotica]|uniref:Uncharacterized protein n=1 Tax=Candidatus Fukatsuia symbiotica TaxID=1878942 RepID=A0A2U8I358_9GAMM|nr:hypothetical protein [Candidatus Fukatsuia symbiotica]AWK13538.1 hypothetical protein CCS41_01910 [Candidatus Fukatsuia symbiotica]MEA9445328.1 hypothetical protein [Candidatus Fukatsuia symbiotica]
MQQIPLLAEECCRIYALTNQLKKAIFEAEKQIIKRVLRHGENENVVLYEMKQLLDAVIQEENTTFAETLEKWQQLDINKFLQRDYNRIANH